MQTTREKLVEVAAHLVDEGGPAAVTLREVGARAGLSHNAPYKHFADKRDLLATVAAAELNRLATDITEAAAAHSPGAEAVRHAARTYLRWAQTYPARFQLVFGPWGDHDHDELGAAADRAVTAIGDCVLTALADGSLRGRPDRVTALVWSLGHGAVDLHLTGHLQKKPGAATPEELVDDLLTLLSPPPE